MARPSQRVGQGRGRGSCAMQGRAPDKESKRRGGTRARRAGVDGRARCWARPWSAASRLGEVGACYRVRGALGLTASTRNVLAVGRPHILAEATVGQWERGTLPWATNALCLRRRRPPHATRPRGYGPLPSVAVHRSTLPSTPAHRGPSCSSRLRAPCSPDAAARRPFRQLVDPRASLPNQHRPPPLSNPKRHVAGGRSKSDSISLDLLPRVRSLELCLLRAVPRPISSHRACQ